MPPVITFTLDMASKLKLVEKVWVTGSVVSMPSTV
jgi:hypothetical protein